MRKWLIGLAFLSSILVMTLFAVEFALNKFAPNKRWKSIHNKLVRHNSHGFRYRERTYEKEEGVFRILVLGDSMTKGVQVSLEQNYPYILEALLNSEGGNRFEVVNLAVSGFNTAQEYLLFRSYGMKYQPDLVILAFFNGDDVEENSLVLKKTLADVNVGGGEINNELNYISMLRELGVGEKDSGIGGNGYGKWGAKRDRSGLFQIIKRASARLFPNIYYYLVDWVKKTPWVCGFVSHVSQLGCMKAEAHTKVKPRKAFGLLSYEVYAKEY